jgi:hypothetical protein
VGSGLERTDHCAGVLKTRPVANYTRCPRSRCQPPSGRFQNWRGGQRRRILTVGHFGVADHDKEAKKVPFDPKVFLATANGGRSLSKYRKNKVIFSQGEPADTRDRHDSDISPLPGPKILAIALPRENTMRPPLDSFSWKPIESALIDEDASP